ncbi:MAG: hypothetical protein PHO56_02195 [Patescibacteria group bacterium]|nr:hypothetical protein [Patescibacteria group bacterium]
MSGKSEKKVRQLVKRGYGDMARQFYDHLDERRPFIIPKFIWRPFIKWLIYL